MMVILSDVSYVDYLLFGGICLLCFFIGFFVAKIIYKRKYTVKNAQFNLVSNMKDNSAIVPENKIMAVKTRERRGEAVDEYEFEPSIFKGVKASNKPKPQLNFGSIGVSDISQKNDLKKIKGIGVFIENKLNDIGIYTYEQISRFSDHDIETVTKLIEFFPGRIKRDKWREQALDLLEEKE